MAVEPRRGCGYRRVGGLYIVGGGLSAPCDRMPFPLERCRTCGGGIKFTRGPQWLQPDFFSVHGGEWYCQDCKVPTTVESHTCSHGRSVKEVCVDESPCPVCATAGPDGSTSALPGDLFGPHLLLWIGRKHYTPEAYLEEGRRLGVSRRLSAMPKGLVIGETWVLLAHLDAVPPKQPDLCVHCGFNEAAHVIGGSAANCDTGTNDSGAGSGFELPKPTPGIFCAFVPRAVELILKESDATPERREKEEKRGVTVVTVPDDDKDHQGSVWDKDEEDSQPELSGVAP